MQFSHQMFNASTLPLDDELKPMFELGKLAEFVLFDNWSPAKIVM